MNLKERLNNQNQKNKKVIGNTEPEEVEMYMERSRITTPLNKNKSGFESSLSKGINTDESIFDKYAVFRR